MRVVILGSGVVGVASAWYLNQAGHEVTVIDREPGAALETSAANAGQISPGYAAPWAAPGAVSYTHLDVYKRQVPILLLAWGSPRPKRWLSLPIMRQKNGSGRRVGWWIYQIWNASVN